jgi:16S rRNA processing protein RimM
MGRILAPYGVQGWLKVRPFTGSPEALLAYRIWWLVAEGGAWRKFRVLAARTHSDLVLAQLEGLNRREDVAAWRGASVGVPRAALPALALGEVYLADVLGLEVVNREGTGLGRVTGLVETGAHPVLQVGLGNQPQRLIPLVPAHVDAIDLAAGRIVVDWQPDY